MREVMEGGVAGAIPMDRGALIPIQNLDTPGKMALAYKNVWALDYS